MGVMDELALNYLNKEKLTNIDMIESINRGFANVLAAGDDGVLLFLPESSAYMLSCENSFTAARFIQMFEKKDDIVTHHDFEGVMVREAFNIEKSIRCYHCVYEKSEPVPIDESFDIRNLDAAYADYVDEIYAHENKDYILSIMEEGNMLGAFVDGKLAGFIGIHGEGSIGLLVILEQYRRMHLGYELEARMINKELERGHIPYCQVLEDNENSLALQRSLGYTLSEGRVEWNF